MTPVDIFNRISQDRPKIEYWLNKAKSKAEKSFKSQYKFPKYYIEEYKNKESCIEYLLISFLSDSKSKSEEKIMAKCCLENKKYYIDFGYTFSNVDFKNQTGTAQATLNIYNAHFFNRYKERILKDEHIEINDVIGLFFARMLRIHALNINDEIIKDWRTKYGEFSIVVMTNEGICLGKSGIYQSHNMPSEEGKCKEVIVYEFNTIITKSMLSDSQKEAIEKEELEYSKQYYKQVTEFMISQLWK